LSTERIHGGVDLADLAEHGLSTGDVTDFSVNLNPYGPAHDVVAAARASTWERYPDPRALSARSAWAQTLGTTADHIAVGQGAADLFWAMAHAFVEREQRVVIAEPTFSEMRVAAENVGAVVERVWADERAGFAFSGPRIAHACRGAALLYVCTPNNPTGRHVPAREIDLLARAMPDTKVVVDQSFLSLSDHADEQRYVFSDNVIVVRSLTKDFALAGLRVGYLVAAPALVERIEAQRPTWHTSAPALGAIEAAAHAEGFVRRSQLALRTDRAFLQRELSRLGVRVCPSTAPFVLAEVGDGQRVREALFAQGIVVRDCASFGLPNYVRIAVRPIRDTQRLITALANTLVRGRARLPQVIDLPGE
jgi:histidinol-phosphate aminotransferase